MDQVEQLLPTHRERLYPPTETLSMFLAQALSEDRSCQHIVDQSAIQRLCCGLSVHSTSTGGYCRARKRLPVQMVSELTKLLSVQVDQQLPEQWRWQGRRVQIVDGTTATMPDTAANQTVFPQQRGQKPGLGFPICRIVGITCLASGTLSNAAIGRFNGKGGSEQVLLRSIQDTFESGDVVLGDAFFATYFFIATMQSRGIDILMQQHGSRQCVTDFRRGTKLGQRDHTIVISKPKYRPEWMDQVQFDAAPDSVTVREFKAGGKIMITTMLCEKKHPKQQLRDLYKMRWNIELDLRSIKDVLGMNILSCKTPAMVIKEIWIHLLAYNLIRLMIAQSALLADIAPRTISFKHCVQMWSSYLQQSFILDENNLFVLFLLIAQQRVGNRRRCKEPRAVKRRPKAYPMLMIPREQARALVQKYGHPKKLK